MADQLDQVASAFSTIPLPAVVLAIVRWSEGFEPTLHLASASVISPFYASMDVIRGCAFQTSLENLS